MKTKKILIILLSLTLLNSLIFYEFPHKIGEAINERLPININYYERFEAPDMPLGYDWTVTHYELVPGSNEYCDLVELLSNSYYHYSIVNMFTKSVDGTDYYDIRYTNKSGKIIWFGFSDQMDMKINYQYAKIGYLTDHASKQLCNELYKLIVKK